MRMKAGEYLKSMPRPQTTKQFIFVPAIITTNSSVYVGYAATVDEKTTLLKDVLEVLQSEVVQPVGLGTNGSVFIILIRAFPLSSDAITLIKNTDIKMHQVPSEETFEIYKKKMALLAKGTSTVHELALQFVEAAAAEREAKAPKIDVVGKVIDMFPGKPDGNLKH